ncbi:hypothetical protein NUACC21_32930 [Scytonema sp. NUACC21]
MTENSINWDSIRADLLSDPAFKAEYDALEAEFDIASRLIALRSETGLTQRQFAARVGMKQSQLARIESGKQIPKLETLAKIAAAAGYTIEVHFISQPETEKPKIKPLKIDLSDIDSASCSQSTISVLKSVTDFLESNDPVAVKVRKQLESKSISETAANLEKCFHIPDEDDRLCEVKKVLAGGVTGSDRFRNSSHTKNDIELLDLAEQLLEKLSEIIP